MKAFRLVVVVSVIVLTMTVLACTGNKASELYGTAKFEELQNNPEHAIELYEQIIVRYPSSEFAVKAKERIDKIKKKQ